MHHFFSHNIQNNTAFLDEDESRHCTKVMRLGVGDQVKLYNGVGSCFLAEIASAGKTVELQIVDTLQSETAPKCSLTLAISPTKSADRMEWMVEKLVEIGVYKLAFIKTEKGERSRINEKRLLKKAVSALKQSGNLWLPEIKTEVKFKDFISNDTSSQKYIAHCFDHEKHSINKGLDSSEITVLIGPEGDFSLSEVEMAKQHNYKPLSLGVPRYRTETAAVVASTLIHHFYVTLES